MRKTNFCTKATFKVEGKVGFQVGGKPDGDPFRLSGRGESRGKPQISIGIELTFTWVSPLPKSGVPPYFPPC